MNWSLAILQAILIAGITTWINFLINKRQKTVEFDYDYRKYILEKRKQAYTVIEETINALRGIENKMYGAQDVAEANKVLRRIMQSTNALIWASPKMAEALDSLQTFHLEVAIFGLNEYEEGQEMNREQRDAFWNTFKKHHRKFLDLISNLETVFFEDVINLNKIDSFINNRSTWSSKALEDRVRHHDLN